MRRLKKWSSSVRACFVLRSSPSRGNKWNCLFPGRLKKKKKIISIAYWEHPQQVRPKIFLFRENANSYKSEKETPSSKEQTWSFFCTSIVSHAFAGCSLHFPLQLLEGAVFRQERTPEVWSGTMKVSDLLIDRLVRMIKPVSTQHLSWNNSRYSLRLLPGGRWGDHSSHYLTQLPHPGE